MTKSNAGSQDHGYDSDVEEFTDSKESMKIEQLTAQIEQLTNKNTRLRKARNIHRDNSNVFKEKNKELIIKNKQMKQEIKNLGVKDKLIADDVYDSDAEDEKPQKLIRSKTPASNLAINNTKNAIVAGGNKKYLDVPMFNGDRK